MTKETFTEIAKSYLYLDGATGSNLVKAGMPSGVCPEQWILEHAGVMLELQRQYVAAGTDILYAPTFTANRIKLAEYGLEGEMASMIKKLVAISREAASGAGHPVYVAGDLTMTGEMLKPLGKMELEDLISVYKEQIILLREAGVDLLVVETMMSLAETRAALIAAKEVCDLPVMVTMTFEPDGRTLYGTDAETAAVVLESLGASAIGVNCSTGPGQMRRIVADMVSCTSGVPIIAKPNAGLPYLDKDGKSCYSMAAEEFAGEMKLLAEAGASILGGCCGTGPEYIQRLCGSIGKGPVPDIRGGKNPARILASERRTVTFGLEDGLLIVGERINPTGKKMLQSQLRQGCFDKVLQFAREQEECGAGILDVNMGMSGIDEKEMMLRALEEIGGVTDLPLSLDSSHVDVLEAALRHYPGRALVNSVSMEQAKMEKLLPLVKKYGAMFILLPLSDAGLPENKAEKRRIIETIVSAALKSGMAKEDIIVDGLVATVGANPNAAVECLETIAYCRKHDLATVCGLSNISFGLPERSCINTAFLTAAITRGLTMAIANPAQKALVDAAYAADLLMNKPGADLRYIRRANRLKGEASFGPGDIPRTPGSSGAPVSPRQRVFDCVVEGGKGRILEEVKLALKDGEDPKGLIDGCLIPAINRVGELFEQQAYFLPQLISSAGAMQNAIAYLEPMIKREAGKEDTAVIIMATVEGDIHDIGKNLVVLMLRNYGYRVIDLGKDVTAERIVEAAIREHAAIIGLSALMTTTMMRMKDVVELAAKKNCGSRIIIGGAAVTESFAEEIGAHGYSKDAAECVRLVERLLKNTPDSQ